MKLNRINFLLVATLVLLGYFTVQADQDQLQKPILAKQDDVETPFSDGLPKELSPEQLDNLETEKYTFQTEVSRLMHLIINSLYKSREIFLREIISNASDALDKIRFLSLTDPEALKSNSDLRITIAADPESKTLVITDSGIGMTRKQLKDNLGTIAKSGTSEFLAKMEQNTDAITQIGQFGVGFYSVFLVADKVTVASKSNDDEDQHIWQSTAVDDFTIAKDPRGNTLLRGTQITLHLKPDAYRFLQEKNLKELVYKYSQFITFPIMVWSSEEKEVPVIQDIDDDELIEESIDEEPKTEKRIVHDWHHVNVQKPIWMRDSKDITEKEHQEFFKSLTRDTADPLAWSHFKGEGEIEFRSVLYIPSAITDLFYNNIKTEQSNKPIKLFVKRVFISDEVELLPKWLSFLKGIVDADDMPLNVSRETLQKHRSLRIITRHLIKKALDMFTNLSKSDPAAYKKFLAQYGTILKYGAIEEQSYRKKLTSLLRFSSSFDTEPFSSSLDDYIERAKAEQRSIFFMTGSNIAEIEQSPFIEALLARGYEIIYFTDPIDETFVENIPGYNGKMFVNIAKGDVDFAEDDKDMMRDSELENKFRPLTEWLVSTLNQHIDKAVVSRRLTTSPLAIVAPRNGLSGHAQRVLDAQGVNHKNPNMEQIMESMRSQKKILEINPNHPVMETLLDYVEQDNITKDMTNLIQLLYETTSIKSGFPLKDITQFAGRVEGLIRKAVGISILEEAKVRVKRAEEKTEEERLADEEMKKTNIIYETEDDIEHDEL
ncbi:Hsp90 protein-domain-containing protein [Mucor mucedo]|uniref:Hsp90 protein-domain-containing protein n=1 Tax=Mucor mucedo TaxID=29922 RepID=UPI002220D480|nr:Hsp90 protein-domain-containing protein [Mucor mucedo]KAI7889558.1 Hsp90 protein-domain-containing protein [Mucor mucedo]